MIDVLMWAALVVLTLTTVIARWARKSIREQRDFDRWMYGIEERPATPEREEPE